MANYPPPGSGDPWQSARTGPQQPQQPQQAGSVAWEQPPPQGGWNDPRQPGGPFQTGYGYGAPLPSPVDVLGRPLAQWWRRLVAYLVDAVIVAIPQLVIYFSVARNAVVTSVNPDTGQLTNTPHLTLGVVVAWLAGVIIALAYFGVMNGSARGQTVGKMTTRIAVRDIATGGPLGIPRAVLRWFLMALFGLACGIPLLIDCLAPLWDKNRQAWHDLAARSVVIEIP